MKRKRHSEEEIIKKLREAQTMQAGGASIEEACRKLEIRAPTYHRWKQEYGGAKVETVKRLKELERENARLKKLVAEQALEMAILKEVAEGSVVLAAKPEERRTAVRFMVFDAPGVKGVFEERMTFLSKTIPSDSRLVKVVPQERCKNPEQLIAERDRIVSLGGEGLMLRKPDSEYEAGRSPTLLKVKPHDDAEATVIAHIPEKGKYEGQVG